MSDIPCFECGRAAVHYHHVVRRVHGGTRTVPVCEVCHGLIHDRNFLHWKALQKAGIERAKAEGRGWGGRKKGVRISLTADKQQAIEDMNRAGKSVSEIARVVGLGRQSVYRALGRWERTPRQPA